VASHGRPAANEHRDEHGYPSVEGIRAIVREREERPAALARRYENAAILELDKGNIIEYVGGAHPYIWIGTPDGHCIDYIDLKKLREFLRGKRG
jgi:hypothetical protein